MPITDPPPWLAIAQAECDRDVHEVPGPRDNPRVVEYLQSTTVPINLLHDATPWCGAFVNWCLLQCGVLGTNNASARSWQRWGIPLIVPRVGCICVFAAPERGPKAGHVGFYMRELAAQHIDVLGGNQHNRVCELPYPKAHLIGYRWGI